ncbi:ATP-binding protein [Sulfidibacter corallicola]|uniref:ATP-binding protein n=1 Tax=Sulfidibacter corallicola TaxID=2818388 RepID=A0A8A4TYJ8_SULCO|nr:ATP-binding protein [Sulfidibacter corallicola]QTD54164.1 ATP-binding protein [Sulfidibacter corallicola]
MKLPTEKQPKNQSLISQTVLLYGPNKIGKTELCAQIPDTLFLATEAGHNHVEAFVQPIKNWEDFLKACAEIAKMDHSFKVICIDTVTNLLCFCTDHVCAQHGIQHESDMGYGKGYALVRNEFIRALTKLSMLPVGLWMTAHSTEKAIETRTGTRTRIVPNLPEKMGQFILDLADIVALCSVDRNEKGLNQAERVIYTKPSPDYVAGDRSGRLEAKLPMTYAALAKAFEATTPEPQTQA